MAGGVRSLGGGILGLVGLIEEHGPAIDFDLLTLTNYGPEDLGTGLPWSRFLHFVSHLPADSALMRELEPEQAPWTAGHRSADILADIFDLLQAFQGNFINANSKRKARKTKPYPRPWLKPKARRFGKDPIPVDRFDDWWEGGGRDG